MTNEKYRVTWSDYDGKEKVSNPLHLEAAEFMQLQLLSNNIRSNIERIITKDSENFSKGKYQIYLDGFAIFPNVPDKIFSENSLIDAMPPKFDSDQKGNTTKRYPDAKGVECLFPMHGHSCYVLVEDGVVIDAFTDQLPDIPIVSRERWNREWDWTSNHDLSKYVFFSVENDQN